MSHLTRYHQDRPEQPLGNTSDAEEIRALLAEAGVRFERWRADRPLPADADQAQIGAAYRSEIDRLMREGGYQSWDVISMRPDIASASVCRSPVLLRTKRSSAEMKRSSTPLSGDLVRSAPLAIVLKRPRSAEHHCTMRLLSA